MTRTILLADDSVTIQKVIELTFMEEDYEVVSASDGDEALERLEETTPDFVIADVHMPGASGIDVCRRAKELYPQVPVLLLVGTFEPFDEGAAQAAGADAHLKKPFDSQELIQLVGDLMSAPEAGEAEPQAEPAAPVAATSAEPEADDTWGFSAAAAELQAAEETPAGEVAETAPAAAADVDAASDLDWTGPLEPQPEEEAPAAVGQAEEPAPGWERPHAAVPAGTGGEPFHLGPVERAERGGDVFDLSDDAGEETAEGGPERVAAGEDGGGAERWGFAVDGSPEEPVAAAAAAADTGWEEVEEPSAVEDPAWGEPERHDPSQDAAALDRGGEDEGAGVSAPPPWADEDDEGPERAAPPPDWDGEAESRVSAPPPDWDGDAESRVAAPPPDWDGEDEDARAGAPPPDWDGESATAAGDSVDAAKSAESAEESDPDDAGVAEPVPGSGAAYGGARVSVPESAPAAAAVGFAAASAGPAEAAGSGAATGGGLSEQDVDRIARRVAELLGERVTREVAWEVVPDLAEVVIRERLRELEGQID